ncbi:MAG: hypothetical protein L6R37_002260 [Teloschistes peruensis]|nr:MAG: hypothetical protein L6R37_002260 [Teloschistes peruensis]
MIRGYHAMLITNHFLYERVKMGNASSQPLPAASNGCRSSASFPHDQSPGKDKNRKRSSKSERTSDQEEDLCVLMQLEESRHRSLQSSDDPVVNSSRLFNKTSPVPTSNISTTLNGSKDITVAVPSDQTRQHKTKSKRTPNVLEASSDAGNANVGPVRECPRVSAKNQTEGKADQAVEKSSASKVLHPLDTVDENDETLSNLFKEYETQASQFESPLVDNAGGTTPFQQDLIDPAWTDPWTDPAPTEPDGGKEHGEKRKRHAGSNAFDDAGTEQELLNGTGQHAFDFDFEAFDEIFANDNTQVANPSDEESGLDWPNGARSPAGPPTTQANVETSTRVEDDPIRTDQRAGKLPRIPSMSRPNKRKRGVVPDSLDIQAPVYISPYAPTQGQQDEVLPGLEDLQSQSLEIPISQPLEIDSHLATKAPRKHNTSSRTHSAKPDRSRQRGDGHNDRDSDPLFQGNRPKGGMFSDHEAAQLEAFRDCYCEAEEISKHRFNELIQSKMRESCEVHRLFTLLYEEMPYRKHQSIARYCRRQFHNFSARGAWTDADDEDLRNAVALKGKSWIAVGALIGRSAEDSRDRYRNYHINAEQKFREAWTHDEVFALVQAVKECMQLLREERIQAKEQKYRGHEVPESEPESDQDAQDAKFINWQVVSERMGGTRSRLQCSYKWNHLKEADRLYYFRTLRRIAKGKGFRKNAEKESWRLQRACKKLKNMRPGDRYDFLQAFADCNAPTEHTITWKSLGSAELRDRWSTTDFKAALQLFKDEVPGSSQMNYQEVINRVYTRFIVEASTGFEERWQPDVHGDINEHEKEQKKAGRVQGGSKNNRVQTYELRRHLKEQKSGVTSRVKSKALIDSDDDSVIGQTSDHETPLDERMPSGDEAMSTLEVADSVDQGSTHESSENNNSADDRAMMDSTRQRSVSFSEDSVKAAGDTPLDSQGASVAAHSQTPQSFDSDSNDSLFNDSGDEHEDSVEN